MSGGVDSSVAAMLLKEQGYEVVGVFMRNWDEQDETGSDVCTADADLEDARMVGIHLGIEVETVNFSRRYWNEVFAPSLEEFERCRTPNMDVACNRFIKFDAFREHALGNMGADLVATGHYARTQPGPGWDWDRPVLLQAKDENKDQTYFLCGVPSSALARVLFPLGGLTKTEVRELASKAGLPVARKRESMGVCFVGKRKSWAEFLSQYITPNPGNFVCADTGEIMGVHSGAELYTVGQKSQLSGMVEKYYVAGVNRRTNSVIVARGALNPALFARGLSASASEFHWVAGVPPPELLPTTAPSSSSPSSSSSSSSSSEGSPGEERLEEPPIGSREHHHHHHHHFPRPRRRLLRCTYRFRHGKELRPCTVELVVAGEEVSSFSSVFPSSFTCDRGFFDPHNGGMGRAPRVAQEGGAAVAAAVATPSAGGTGSNSNSSSSSSNDKSGSISGSSSSISSDGNGSVREAAAPSHGGEGLSSSSPAMTMTTMAATAAPLKQAGERARKPTLAETSRDAAAAREVPSLTLPSPSRPPPQPPSLLVVLYFDEPARAVAPGQVVALYRDGVCLGGGSIARAEGRCAPVMLRAPPLPPPPLVSLPKRNVCESRRGSDRPKREGEDDGVEIVA